MDHGSDVGDARTGSVPSGGPLPWDEVLRQEYRALYGTDPFSGAAPRGAAERLRILHEALHERRPTALCLSGGGIRSGTFGLGVLQALAEAGTLGTLNYLSTVSGGGYIGGWLTTWLHRDARSDVFRQLDPDRAGERRRTPGGISPIERLRATCRYLAPRGGLLSADVWTVATTMARNLLLNWMVLLPLIAAVLLVPRAYMATVALVEQNVLLPAGQPCLAASAAPFWFVLASLSLFVVAIGYVVMNFLGRGERWSQARFLGFVVAPTLAGTVALTLFWSAYPCAPDEGMALFLSAVLPAAGWLVIGAVARARTGTALLAAAVAGVTVASLAYGGGWTSDRPLPVPVAAAVPLMLLTAAALVSRLDAPPDPLERAVRMAAGVRTVAAALIAGPIVGLGSYWFAHKYFYFGDPLGPAYAVFAVPGILALILLSNTVFLGLASGELTDAALEWWNRFAAWLAIGAVLWLAAGVLVFYLADAIEYGIHAAARALRIEHGTSAAAWSVMMPLVSSLAGLAARSGGIQGRPSALRLAVQRLALPLTIVTLLASVAWFNGWALRGFTPPSEGGDPVGLGGVLLFGGALAALGLTVSRFVPVNRFSLHGMYRQRLVRTFLGASHWDRQPNAFTGFDPGDDVRVHDLRHVRPLPVINATLNNVETTRLGRNERKAYAFTFSPLHVGSPVLGYRPAAQYGSDGGPPGSGLSLGTALSVSGAAASPAMGMYSSKARAFLLTLANARLGLWFGNPRDDGAWRQSEPSLGVGPLVRELLGLATDANPYVYLSDGGHFENLGLWSMVVRRCGLIIVSDAGCDPDYTFADLSNAVRRIRIDLGIPIEFDALPFTRAGQGHGNPHVALGTIRYSAADGPGAPDGRLLYIKATLSGDEPVDVLNFARTHPAFPHDPTGNQFFDEDRFESYRALGYHSVLAAAGALKDADAWALYAAVARGASPRSAAAEAAPI